MALRIIRNTKKVLRDQGALNRWLIIYNKIVSDYDFEVQLIGKPYDLGRLDNIVSLIDNTINLLNSTGGIQEIPSSELTEVEQIRQELLGLMEPKGLVG
jgi:hypothetical protein